MNTIHITNGHIYINQALYQTYFAGLKAMILLIREQRLHILPVQSAAHCVTC